MRSRTSAIIISSFLIAACSAPDEPDSAGITEGAVNTMYREPHRPRFHFTPPAMWMNDPNGMVYFEGEYHLFYQYYPGEAVWGPMHWGHAISRDLVHWQHLPIALYPDEKGYIFSGSAVVDWQNTSGLGTNGKPPLIAIFTYHDPERGRANTGDHESQSIAYSNDSGRTWIKYEGNPVLPNPGEKQDFRDPNVFWHVETGRWVMVLSATDHVEMYASDDFKSWEYLSSFGEGLGAQGGVWECPDLFELTAEDGSSRWVLLLNLNPGGPQGGSGTQYFVGQFDGKSFTLDPSFEATLASQDAVWLDYGADNYAGVTWSDLPEEDGRRIFIGWMSNWAYGQEVPTSPWRSAMTVPRSLHLDSTPTGYRVSSKPVRELDSLMHSVVTIPDQRVGEKSLTAELPGNGAEVTLDLALADGSGFVVELSNDNGDSYQFGYDAGSNRYFSDRRNAGDDSFSPEFADSIHYAPRLDTGAVVTLRLLVDVSSVEAFADGGTTVITDLFFPSAPFNRLSISGRRGSVVLERGSIAAIDSIWIAAD